MADTAKIPWRIVGEEVASCNCAWGCPCQFNALPTHGRCEALVAVRVREGHYGETKLDGVMFGGAWWFPGPIHEGKGIGQPAVDDRATPEQRTALVNIITGKAGGMPWDIFAAITETFRDPMFIRMALDSDREARLATFSAPGLGEFRIESIKNPVTGEEHRAMFAAVEWTNV